MLAAAGAGLSGEGGGFQFFFLFLQKASSVIVRKDLVRLNLANKREQPACEHILVSVVSKTKWINGELDQGLGFDATIAKPQSHSFVD